MRVVTESYLIAGKPISLINHNVICKDKRDGFKNDYDIL